MKRLLALLCSLALVFCLLPSTAFAEGGNGNIDGGGGSMGQGTSSNFWNPGNDGVRITVVDADSGTAISSPVDFSNRSQNNVLHFGKVNKLQYLGGTALTPPIWRSILLIQDQYSLCPPSSAVRGRAILRPSSGIFVRSMPARWLPRRPVWTMSG